MITEFIQILIFIQPQEAVVHKLDLMLALVQHMLIILLMDMNKDGQIHLLLILMLII